jgi:hypothetical protein
MKQPREMPWILAARRLPGLYTREDVKNRLGLRDVDAVSKLVEAGLLKLLGDRQGTGQMYFWADDIEERVHNPNWMDRAVRVVQGPAESKGGKARD